MAVTESAKVRWGAGKIVSQLKAARVLEGRRTWVKVSADGKPVLLSAKGQEPPPLVVRCPLRGTYAVTIGIYYPDSRQAEKPGTLSVVIDGVSERFVLPTQDGLTTFYLGVHRLKGSPIVIEKINLGAVGVSHILFEKHAAPGPSFARGESRRSPILWGIIDQADQAIAIASSDIRDVATGVRYHRELGFNTISWHMYLGSCEFPTRAGTTFPLIDFDNRDHLRMMAEHKRAPYVDALWREFVGRYDTMEQGIRLAREQGLKYMPCMRMNNEWHADWCLGHASKEFLEKFWCPEFFMKHPEYWARYKNGKRTGGGMDYSHAAVRKYRLGILRDVMDNYPKIDGMFLDLHRHPPMVSYPDKVVEAFKKKYGVDVRRVTPINENVMDPRWLKFRARYFTDFMRALKKEKNALGRRYPTVVRTATTFADCLFECADLQMWFDEKLVDALILETRGGPDYGPSLAPVVQAASKAGVKVLGGFANPSFVMETPWRKIAAIAERWLAEGAAGVAFYESNALVCSDNLRKNMPGWVRSLG